MMEKPDRQVFYFGISAFILTNLHLLRNISPIFSALTLLSLMVVTVAIFWRGLEIRRGAITPMVLLVTCMVIAVLNSYLSFPEELYIDKIPRFVLTIPFIFVGAMLTRSQLRQFLFVSAVFGALGGASLLIQILIGPIGWFAEASERGGLIRYASILGSLTIFGTFAGIALSAAYFAPGRNALKGWIVFFISIGCIFSLQKAAILNMLMFFAVVAFVEIRHKRYFAVGIALFSVFVFSVFLSIYFGDYFDLALNNFFRMDDSAPLDDYDPIEGLIQRLWELPSKLYEIYGLGGLLFGVGLVGGAGALGFPDHPMAHNFVFDMLFIGGVPYLLVYSFVIVATIRRVWSLRSHDDGVAFASLCCILFFVFNLPATTGIQFHPVISSIVNVLIGFYFVSPLRLKALKYV